MFQSKVTLHGRGRVVVVSGLVGEVGSAVETPSMPRLATRLRYIWMSSCFVLVMKRCALKVSCAC